jgi:Na+-transporting NADH:ubiquinone oxidoreductase subunit NqrC
MEDEERDRILAAILAILTVALVSLLLWSGFSDYINPATAAQRKDVVNMFILSLAGLVGSLTALAAVGNLYLSRMNLQQQRDLDDRRAQDDALQNYFGQMGELLTTHRLDTRGEDDSLRLLARAHTLTVLRGLEDPGRKRDVTLFLDGVKLINRNNTIVSLRDADLSGADLSGADLEGAFLNGAKVEQSQLEEAEDRTGVTMPDGTLHP